MMKRTAHAALSRLPLIVSTICLLTSGQLIITAQQTAAEQQATKTEPVVERDESGRVTIKLLRGVRVSVGNRTTGRITVTGWDHDTIEARAISERGAEYVRTMVTTDSSGTSILVKADYAEGVPMAHRVEFEQRRQEMRDERKNEREERRKQREEQGSAMPSGLPPGTGVQVAPVGSPSQALPDQLQIPLRGPADSRFVGPRPGEIDLEVKLPRYAEIEMIRVYRSDVEVTGVETNIVVNGDKSGIKLNRVGSAEVRTRSGPVEVERASGLVDVITTTGPIRVREAGSDVRALSISGQVEIQCTRGLVNVGNTDGAISLFGVGGDVDATSTSGEIRLTGTIRERGRYYLKSMSGLVEMSLRPNPAGFTATLSSYRGAVEAGFVMKIIQSRMKDPTNHRIVSRYGNGQAQVTLDSFDGPVRLNKAISTVTKDCH